MVFSAHLYIIPRCITSHTQEVQLRAQEGGHLCIAPVGGGQTKRALDLCSAPQEGRLKTGTFGSKGVTRIEAGQALHLLLT